MGTLMILWVAFCVICFSGESKTIFLLWYSLACVFSLFFLVESVSQTNTLSSWTCILKQKSLATHYRYAYLLQNPRWNNTNWIRYFVAVSAITILSNTKYCKISFVWSALPVIIFFQKDNISIFQTFSACIGDGSRQFWWTLTYQRQLLDVILVIFT